MPLRMTRWGVVTWLLGEMEVVEQSSNSGVVALQYKANQAGTILQRQKANKRNGLNNIRLAAGLG